MMSFCGLRKDTWQQSLRLTDRKIVHTTVPVQSMYKRRTSWRVARDDGHDDYSSSARDAPVVMDAHVG
jgi:hypothetical protein